MDAYWPAPAKLNLFLHVIGRRADGYHELQTLFQPISLHDELRFWVSQNGVIERTAQQTAIPESEDLVIRAARALRERAAIPDLGVRIEVVKRIPVGGGLGGGSSDAATTLVALNALWGLEFSTATLAGLGRDLGADVPFFIYGSAAIGRGIGELLEPVDLPPASFAVIFPNSPVATASAFQAPELTRNSPVIKIEGFLSRDWPLEALPGRNDLQPVVVARHPAVMAALSWLGERGHARLTGSGGCVFAAFMDTASAAAALVGLPAQWQGFVATSLNVSPLELRLAHEGAR
jgi:4-diphosphocytidyl-2-C-methyl-D-erythritol kinase